MRTLTGLSKPVLKLDGEPLKEVNGKEVSVGWVIANSLARGSSEDAVRAIAVALKIHNGGDEVELEDADFALAQQALAEDRFMNNMAKAAALVVLNGSGVS